jgi:hypothetical protein
MFDRISNRLFLWYVPCLLTLPLAFVLIFVKDNPTNKFGEALRNQVEERLTFFEVIIPAFLFSPPSLNSPSVSVNVNRQEPPPPKTQTQ